MAPADFEKWGGHNFFIENVPPILFGPPHFLTVPPHLEGHKQKVGGHKNDSPFLMHVMETKLVYVNIWFACLSYTTIDHIGLL